MSSYAQSSGSGGSVYAQPGGTTNSSPYAGGGSSGSPAPSHSSGFFGALAHIPGVTAVEHAAHTVEGGVGKALAKTEDTAASIATGTYDLAKSAVAPGTHPSWATLGKEWAHAIEHPLSVFSHQNIQADPLAKNVVAIGNSMKTSVEHPLRDPVNTALTAFTAASLGAGGLARLGYAARVAKAAKIGETGDLVVEGSPAAKAAEAAGHTVTPLSATEKASLTRKVANPRFKPPTAQRALKIPVAKLEKPAGEGPAALNVEHVPVELHASTSHLVRAYQAAHDAIVQHSLDRNFGQAKTSTLAKYAKRRASAAVSEGMRVTANQRGTLEKMLAASGRSFDKGVTKKEGQLALALRSWNVLPHEAQTYWEDQAKAGFPTDRLAALSKSIADKGLLEVKPDGNVGVAEAFPKLVKAETLTAAAQAAREQILGQHGLMSPEGMTARKALPAETIRSEAARNETTGVRTGQGYTPLRTSEKRAPQTPLAAARGNGVIPNTKKLSVGKQATGAGIQKGLVPDNTTLGVARALHEALRYTNTVEFRAQAARLGGDVKQSANDVLIRDPSIPAEGKIPESIDVALGRRESRLGMIKEDEASGIQAAIRARLEEDIPGLRDKFAENKAAGIGTRAPEGFKWIPKQLLPAEITRTSVARNSLEKTLDTINSAITSATVYLKLGHFPTRLLTNFSTNVVQGSAKEGLLAPFGIGETAKLLKGLTEEEKHELAAVTGTHGYAALPHQGTNLVAKVASRGAGWWAQHVDAPFRINAIAYELRQVGINTPEGIREVLAYLKDPTAAGKNAAWTSKVDWAVRHANRASIMYDGLNDVEKRYLTRLFWFYPWTKGAVRFAFHTAAEHPVKATAIAGVGQLGSQYRTEKLGPVPTYEQTLTPIFGGGNAPYTANLSSFTPFETLGGIAGLAAHPLNPDTGLTSQLNPVYSAIAALLQGHGLGYAASQALQPTPEAQIAAAAAKPPTPTQMFGPTNTGVNEAHAAAALSALLRALGGPAVPRPTRKASLAKNALHQHEKHRDIRIYTP